MGGQRCSRPPCLGCSRRRWDRGLRESVDERSGHVAVVEHGEEEHVERVDVELVDRAGDGLVEVEGFEEGELDDHVDLETVDLEGELDELVDHKTVDFEGELAEQDDHEVVDLEGERVEHVDHKTVDFEGELVEQDELEVVDHKIDERVEEQRTEEGGLVDLERGERAGGEDEELDEHIGLEELCEQDAVSEGRGASPGCVAVRPGSPLR